MGIYISKPITDKDSCDEEYNKLKCGSSSMQGWRTAQEVSLMVVFTSSQFDY